MGAPEGDGEIWAWQTFKEKEKGKGKGKHERHARKDNNLDFSKHAKQLSAIAKYKLMLTNLDLGSCAMKILDVINIVIPIRKTVSLMSQRDITIISTASRTGEI